VGINGTYVDLLRITKLFELRGGLSNWVVQVAYFFCLISCYLVTRTKSLASFACIILQLLEGRNPISMVLTWIILGLDEVAGSRDHIVSHSTPLLLHVYFANFLLSLFFSFFSFELSCHCRFG